jgi:phospholipid/cholesterol/gamma-HCH transport system ATP-binding protein
MSESEPLAIRIRGLRTQFGPAVIYENLDLDVRVGEIMGVVGGSGTGKSVLLRTIVGLNKPAAGTIEIFGQDVADMEVPLKEHTELSLELIDQIAALKLSMVGLPPNASTKYPSELSGGMRKRAGLARALALDPRILFLDEPTAGLDPIGAAAFDELILRLQRALGLTVFMVTHDLDSLHTICDRIAVLAEKRVLLAGSMDEMLKEDHPWVREYFHGPRARAAVAGSP